MSPSPTPKANPSPSFGGGSSLATIVPDPAKTIRSIAGSKDAFQALLKESQESPETFWDKTAKELVWIKPWDRVFEGGLPDFKYFVGGMMNPCVNLLDRHIEAGAGNRLALIWEGEDGKTVFLTYRMLLDAVLKACGGLRELGLKKGDTLAMFLPNIPETVILTLACYRLGVIFNTVFSGFSPKSLRDRLERFEPRVLVTADGTLRRGKRLELKKTADEALLGLKNPPQKVLVVRRLGEAVPMLAPRDTYFDDLFDQSPPDPFAEAIEANETGLVIYSSGTTGSPKGVMHASVAFVVNNWLHTRYHMDFHPDDVMWCTADIGWLTSHIWGIVGAFSNGVTSVFTEGALDYPGPSRVYGLIEKYRISKLFTAPTLIRMLMRFGPEALKPYSLDSLQVIGFVGEPLNPEAWRWCYEVLGKKRIYINNTWGQTETAGTPLASSAWITEMKPGSSGKPYLGCCVEIVDDRGNPTPLGLPGNLVVTKPFPMLLRGLWKERERFEREYYGKIPGVYFSYDEALKDEDGHFWVLGRTDDIINVAGHRISTMEIESAVMSAEGVAEVAVVGEPDPLKGLVPVAFVVLRQGTLPSEAIKERIHRAVETSIGRIAIPKAIHFTTAMPKTPSGKILRRLLREIVTEGEVKGDTSGLEDDSSLKSLQKEIAKKERP